MVTILKLLAADVMAVRPPPCCHIICGYAIPLEEKATLDAIASKTHGSNNFWKEMTWWIPPNVRTWGSMLQMLLGRRLFVIRTVVVDCAARVIWLSRMLPNDKLTSLNASPRVLKQTTGNKCRDWFHHLRGMGRRRNNQPVKAKMVETPSLAVVKHSGKGNSSCSRNVLKITWIAQRVHHITRANLWIERMNESDVSITNDGHLNCAPRETKSHLLTFSPFKLFFLNRQWWTLLYECYNTVVASIRTSYWSNTVAQ